MPWEAWFTIGLVVLTIIALTRNIAPDLVLLAALAVLMATQWITGSHRLPSAAQAVAGFGNVAVIAIGTLFVVAEGLVRTGAMNLITQPLLGRPRTTAQAQTRLMLPVAGLSAFLNNTPVVAMFLPVVNDWCKRTGLSPSKLFIPLSYAAIFGGTCTLIGTSTNLVVDGLLVTQAHQPGLGMFEIAWIGVPVAIVGMAYVLVASRWLLPDRRAAISVHDDPRQYTVEMIVQSGGPLVGQNIEQAGLRQLPGLYLVEIERDGQVFPAVSPRQELNGNDRLVFAGVVESVVDLQRIRGLRPATDQVFKLDSPHTQRRLIEAVVSDRCPLIHKTVREGRFRTHYNAAVLAVARSGKRIHSKIGDVVLQPGDTLLLEADASFATQQRDSPDFFLVSQVENSAPMRHERAWVALAVLGLMVAAVTVGWLSLLPAALIAAGLMVVTRCCTGSEARRSVDWSVLLVIGAALGLGSAMQTSGAAQAIAHVIIGAVSHQPWAALAAVYFVTVLFTAVITHNAAAVLVFPIAMQAADHLHVSLMPFVIAIIMAASASFATPFSYQTNLMVYGPGGYRFNDYVRFGLPLNLLLMVVAVVLIPYVWGF